MRHLIIGAGKMGKLHGDILSRMGDAVEYVDLEFKPKNYERNHDGVLICTPPSTHLNIIDSLPTMPIFCEKPLSDKRVGPHIRPAFMGACNWRYCDHVEYSKRMRIKCVYPKAMKLDVIHFLDLFWHNFGKPDLCSMRLFRDMLSGYFVNADCLFEFELVHREGSPVTFITNKRYEPHRCNMFHKQMEDWRKLVMRQIQSPNDFETTRSRLNFLIRKTRGIYSDLFS